MKVRTADGAARHLDNNISAVLDFRVGDAIAANIIRAVPAERFHEWTLATSKRGKWKQRRKLSDAIEDKLEDVIDRVPGGSQVRPLIESTVQVALATALTSDALSSVTEPTNLSPWPSAERTPPSKLSLFI
jgi:hypothetical protein